MPTTLKFLDKMAISFSIFLLQLVNKMSQYRHDRIPERFRGGKREEE